MLLAVVLAAGCKRADQANSSGYFKTLFQDESQFIVETVASDVAEQIFYAEYHQLPDRKYFLVTATEKPGSSLDTPAYDVQVRWDRKHGVVKSEVDLNGPIWSPEMYQGLAQDLAQVLGLDSGSTGKSDDTSLLSNLTDDTVEAIEDENAQLSRALENDFTNPGLHEQAAALLGTFALREHSGDFYEIHFPLCRMTAHLVMARFLRGNNGYGVNGQVADAMLLTLIGDEAPALTLLDTISTNNSGVASFVRALQMRNTGDYRTLDTNGSPSRLESVEWFCAMAGCIGGSGAWPKLSDDQKQTIDFVRVAFQQSHSVEMGHQLVSEALPLELQEISSVYEQSQHKELAQGELVKALNVMPERCFSQSGDGTHVRVIGWGQWAAFLQRQLCHAIKEDFDMLQYKWGVPDDAQDFAAKMGAAYGKLRLYPFVQRFDCTDEKAYHQSVDEGTPVTVNTPQLVPAACWDILFSATYFAPRYAPTPNPHVNEWFHHNPPPGTVYDLSPRFYHPSLTDRPITVFEKLRELAPYNFLIADWIADKKYQGHPTYDQAMDLYGKGLRYSTRAISQVANTVTNQPDQYEKIMLEGAKLSPVFYYDLGAYFFDHNDGDKSMQYYDQACDVDPDRIRASNYAVWRVRNYMKKGQTDKARQIADEGAEVYSSRGLQAEALFFEMTSNYDEAFAWYSKVNERYNEPLPLFCFCMRYKILTGDNRFDADAQTASHAIFPKGIETVSLGDFHGAPTDGVLVAQENDRTKAVGLRQGDVIVAVYGFRMHDFNQYTYAREWSAGPELDLIVWQGDGYHEITASPPNHRFGVTFVDYKPK